jgi:hypothetical protein
VRVDASVAVPLSPADLWRVLVRWEEQAAWLRDADEVRVLTRHRAGAGVVLAVRTRVLRVPAFTERLEVTVWDPPRRLVVAHRRFVRGVGTWTLRPEGAGTRVVWTEELSLPVPVLGELALLAYRSVLRRLMLGGLEALRDSVVGHRPEARPGSIGSARAGESGAAD